jgi:hypothetical protein
MRCLPLCTSKPCLIFWPPHPNRGFLGHGRQLEYLILNHSITVYCRLTVYCRRQGVAPNIRTKPLEIGGSSELKSL